MKGLTLHAITFIGFEALEDVDICGKSLDQPSSIPATRYHHPIGIPRLSKYHPKKIVKDGNRW